MTESPLDRTRLAKDPGERIASAVELDERLRRIELAEPWTAERAERWWQEHDPGVGRTA